MEELKKLRSSTVTQLMGSKIKTKINLSLTFPYLFLIIIIINQNTFIKKASCLKLKIKCFESPEPKTNQKVNPFKKVLN